MATLSISKTFEANHGSFDVCRDTYIATAFVQGPIQNGFVRDVDSEYIKKNLTMVTDELHSRYLDDIVGRGTNENIALYLLYAMREDYLSSLKVAGCGHSVVVYPSDIDYELYPARLLYERARSLLYREKVDDAIEAVSHAIKLDDRFAPAFNLRGRCHRTKERWDLALPDFERAIELDPDFGEAHRNKGNSLLYIGRTAEMIAVFNRAVELMRHSATAINNRGFAYQRLEKWGAALADHTKAIKLDPNYEEAHRDIAIALRNLGREEEAASHERIAEKLKLAAGDGRANKSFY